MSILNKVKVGGRSCDLLTPYVCLGDVDLNLGKRVKTPYEPVGRIEDLSVIEMISKQHAVQKRKAKLEEKRKEEIKRKEQEQLENTPIKIVKSSANLYQRQKRYNFGHRYLNLAINESNRRVKATKSGAVLPDLHHPPEREPLIPPQMDEFLPEVNKSKEIKSVCNNYEAPVPIYLSYGNMKENSCPLFLLSLTNYAQIINDKKIFDNYYQDDDDDDDARYPDVSIIEDILYDLTPYVGICSKWLYENIDSRVVELYEENNIIRKENEFYRIPKFNDKPKNKIVNESEEEDEEEKDEDGIDRGKNNEKKKIEYIKKSKRKAKKSDYRINNNSYNNSLMYSPIQSADKKLLRMRKDLPYLQSQINSVMTKKLEYMRHNRNLVSQYKYMELDNLPPIKDPMESIKMIRNDVEKKRLLLIQSSFKQIIMYKRMLLFIILSFPKRNTLWPINVAFVSEYIKRSLQDGVEITPDIIFNIISKLDSEGLSDSFIVKLLKYIGDLFGVEESDINRKLSQLI